MQASIWLPNEIMYLIIGKLMVFPRDLVRLSAVCKPWRRIVLNLVKLEQHNNPVVVLPFDIWKRGEMFTNFLYKHFSYQMYDMMGECIDVAVSLDDPPSDETVGIIGSSFGWLIVANPKSIWLFNPLSKSKIFLPDIPDDGQCRYSYVKGVLSKPPPCRLEEDGYVDVTITMNVIRMFDQPQQSSSATTIVYFHGEKKKMKPDFRWVWSPSRLIDDYYNRAGKIILDVNSIGGSIYILYDNGTIGCYNWSTHRFSIQLININHQQQQQGWPSTLLSAGSGVVSVHLLESSSSSQLMVVFRYNNPLGFKVFTLSNDDKIIKTWTQIKTLGNDVILLGYTASFCIQASKLLHPSSIYFTYPHKLGAFKLDDDSSISTPPVDNLLQNLKHKSFPPVWLLPSYDDILKFSC